MSICVLHHPVPVSIHLNDGHLNECVNSFILNSPADLDNLEVAVYTIQLANAELTKTDTITFGVDSDYFEDEAPEEGLYPIVTFKSLKILRAWYERYWNKEQDRVNKLLGEEINNIFMES